MDSDNELDEELKKLGKHNELECKLYAWGVMAFLVFSFGLLTKMFISAL